MDEIAPRVSRLSGILYSQKHWQELYLADCSSSIENPNWQVLILIVISIQKASYMYDIMQVNYKHRVLWSLHSTGVSGSHVPKSLVSNSLGRASMSQPNQPIHCCSEYKSHHYHWIYSKKTLISMLLFLHKMSNCSSRSI